MDMLLLFAVALGALIVTLALAVAVGALGPRRMTLGAAMGRGWPTSPEQVGLPSTEVTFTFRDGSASPGWICQGRCEDGPVVVITHGWGNSRYASLAHAFLFRSVASIMVVYDMRAHGDSTAKVSRLGTREADDLWCVITQVREEGKPLILFGSSMGAGVSLAAAARDEQRVINGVIAEAPYQTFLEPLAGHLWRLGYPPYPILWLAGLFLWPFVESPRDFDRARLASRLKCPLLVLHGSKDAVSRPRSGQHIVDAAPDGELVVFENGEHSGLAMHDARKYVGAIEQFVRKVQVGSDKATKRRSDEGAQGFGVAAGPLRRMDG